VVLHAAEEDKDKEYDIQEGVITYTITEKSNSEANDPFAQPTDFAKSLTDLSSNRKRKITTLEKRHEGRNGTRSKKIEDDVITGYNAFEVVLPPYNLDYLAKLYVKSSPHYAAINAKVSNIVGLGYDFVESNSTKSKIDDMEDKEKAAKYRKKLQREKNKLIEFLDELNQEDEFSETLTKVWRDYEATGNGYLEIGREEATGNIGYIGHVPSTTIRVRRQRDGFVQIIANKAVFFRNFGKDDPNPISNDQNPSEIIHIKKYAPGSTFYGVPDIVAATEAVAGNKFAADFNLDYFENKAVPRHVITLKGATINPKLAQNILEFFETGLKGKNHRSLFIPLPADQDGKKVELDIEPVEAGVQDSSFNNYRKSNLGEVLMAHRVPISKVGLAEGVSLAVARDADKTFKDNVCQPEQRVFEKKLNRIVKELTDMLVLKLNEMTLTDENTQSQIDERRIKTGQRAPNELRARDGLPGLPGGDKPLDINAKTAAQPNRSTASTARAEGNRERDSQRSAAATDSQGEGRSAQGEERTNSVK
jgi:PBSX family phage portal protein